MYHLMEGSVEAAVNWRVRFVVLEEDCVSLIG
jgi:hypothetical protein